MRIVSAISFNPEGISVTYMDESDVRAEGRFVQSREMFIARDPANADLVALMSDLDEAVNDLLGLGIQSWGSAQPFDFDAAEPEDDERVTEDEEEEYEG